MARRLSVLALAAFLSACGRADRQAASARRDAVFVNGDFETDAVGATPPGGWTVLNYLNRNGVSGTASAPPSSFAALNLSGPGIGVNETYVVGGSAALSLPDPDLGAGQSFRYPAYGIRAARVNYRDATVNGKNQNANVLRQQMTTTIGDVDPLDGQIHVRFAIAPVLENPAHAFNQQPFFYVELANQTRGTTLFSAFNVAGQVGVPWHTTTSVVTGNATQWLDWQLVDISPGSASLAIGDVVQLTVVASGCEPGGHFGRIYVDGFGASIPGPYVAATAPGSVAAGSKLTYVVRYTNGGSGAALGAHVDLTTPPQTTFDSVSGMAGCTTPAQGSTGTLSCPLGTLDPYAAGTFAVTVNVNPGATGSIVNGNYSIASIGNPTLLGAKVVTQVVSSGTATADLVVTKSAPGAVTPGGTLTYTITLTNNGNTQITRTGGHTATFTDSVPSQLTNVSWTCAVTAAGSGTGTPGPTKCRDRGGSSINNGSGNSITLSPRLGFGGGQITITVTGTAPASGTIVNTASVSAPSGLNDPNLANNTATVTTVVGTPRLLTVNKTGATFGTVSSSPSGISCGASCSTTSATFANGAVVTLYAAPAAGGRFTGWGGACAGTASTCTVTMSAAQTVSAGFAAATVGATAAAVYAYSGSDQFSPTSVSSFASPLQALVTDSSGHPVPNVDVTFVSSTVPSGAAATGLGVARTNALGIAQVFPGPNASAGAYAVDATAPGVAGQAAFKLTNVGVPASITYLNGGNATDPQTAPVNTPFGAPLVAIVRDANGAVVPGATVVYTVVPAGGASATLSSASAVTDLGGMSSVTATANGTVGAYTVIAEVAGVPGAATFSLRNVSSGPFAVFVVSGSPQTAATGSAFGSPLVAVVADQAGNSLQGVTVNFQAYPGPSQASVTSLVPASMTSDASGQASTSATANGYGGTYTVDAWVSGVTTRATFSLTNDGGWTIQVQSGSPQTTSVNGPFAPLQALVLDDTGVAPSVATTVVFQAPTVGATAALSAGGIACSPPSSSCQGALTSTSTNPGVATVSAVASAVSGSYTVIASTWNAATPAVFTLTNGCTDSGQCSGAAPLCDTGSHVCVACSPGGAQNAACETKSASTPYCDVSGACVGCLADSQCTGTTPVCSQATSACAACTTDAQCAGKSGASPFCLNTGACFAGFTLTPSAGPNGTISPAAVQTVGWDGTLVFTFTPATGYHVADVSVDSTSVGASPTYRFTQVEAPHTIAVTFAIDTFTISPSAGSHGAITPPGPQTVSYDGGITFSIVPDPGYHVADVTVDGASVGAQASWSFTHVTASHAIAATFAPDVYPIAVSSTGSGTVTCPATVAYGGTAVCAVAPATGWVLSGLTDDLLDVTGLVVSGTYVISAATGPHTLAATFAKDLGTACGGGGECASGACVDGVCCNGTCGDQCEACNVVGFAGHCTPVLGAPVTGTSAGRVACATDGSVCGGACNGTNTLACAYPSATTCGAGSCAGQTETPPPTCNGFGACAPTAPRSCSPYVCGMTACLTTCSGDAQCVAGDFCSGTSCVPKLDSGAACTGGSQCTSGFCVDGVCCNGACTGQCEACSLGGHVGTCTPVSGAPVNRAACTSDGSACAGSCDGTTTATCTYPTSSTTCRTASCTGGSETVAATCGGTGRCPDPVTHVCAPYACDATACFTACTGDAQCAAADWCSGTTCLPKRDDGATCTAGTQCTSGNCVDGVCCNTACSGQCEACSLGGHVGTCTPVSGPPVNRPACTTDGSACAGSCNGTTTATCTYPDSSTTCRPASCASGTETVAATCGGTGRCPDAVTHACAPYACDATACFTACSGDAQCAAGDWCSGTTCVPKLGNGAACTGGAQCASDHCVDGVCCNGACAGQCEACNLADPALLGTCSPVVGAPVTGTPVNRAACATDHSACGGSCDGTDRAACAYPGASTSCQVAACSDGVATTAASCDGSGACDAAPPQSCGAYVCDVASCFTSCSADGQCAAGYWCDGSHCQAKIAAGGACSGATQCSTGSCVDGVCCLSRCDGACQACDRSGDGTCTVVAGAPVGGRSCAGSGTCAGACDGTRSACTYPADETSCRAATCADGVATLAAACDGAGACAPLQTQACAPYACGAAACLGTCSSESDCAAGDWCSGGVCIPRLENGIACGDDVQCASGHCTDSVCCNEACGGQCEACNHADPALVGTCAPVAGAPVFAGSARPPCDSDLSVCGGACDGVHRTACAYPDASVSCRDAGCAGGVATLGATCDGRGGCPAVQTTPCAPYVCGATACAGDCAGDGDCAAGNWCSAGRCVALLANRDPCSAATQCRSGHCVDGVCCNEACGGQCEACSGGDPELVGTCAPVVGAPVNRPPCGTDGSSCGGACDGADRAACTYPDATVQCRAPRCADGVATLAASCDGTGSCPSPQHQTCAPSVCGATACASGCTSDLGCAAGYWCSAGVCTATLANGTACSGASQCASGNCVDGVCCDGACSGKCEACDVAGHVGACTPVAGAPHGGARGACATDGTACGGSCDGASRTACSFPGTATVCRVATCSAGVATGAATCDGAGACGATPEPVGCGGYACAGDACAASCTTSGECASGRVCEAGACVLPGSAGGWKVAGSGGCSAAGGADLGALALLGLLLAPAAARRRRGGRGAVLLALALALPGAARGQSTAFDAQRFQPLGGARDVLAVPTASVPGHLEVRAGVTLDHAAQPLRLVGPRTITLVDSQTDLTLTGSIGLLDRFEVSVAFPVVAQVDGAPASDASAALPASRPREGVGDLRVTPRALLLAWGPLRLGAALPVTLPTGTSAYAGQSGLAASPLAIAEWGDARGVRVSANLGATLRGRERLANLDQGSAFAFGAGGEVPFRVSGAQLAALATLTGEIGGGAVERPVELLGAVRWAGPRGVQVTVGGGRGLTDGYGMPRYRLLAAVDLAGISLRRPPEPVAAASAPAPEAPPPAPAAPPPPEAPMAAPVVEPALATTVAPPLEDPCAATTSHTPEQCPDLDDDGDGIPNGRDRCPLVAGTGEHQGCPPPKAVLTSQRIEIMEAVLFDSGKDVIQERSFPLLDEVARILVEHAEVKVLSIEGHTDASGDARANQRLSERRAAAVKVYLVRKGIDAGRLETRGFGPSRPVVKEVDAAAKAKNRRVEFLVR